MKSQVSVYLIIALSVAVALFLLFGHQGKMNRAEIKSGREISSGFDSKADAFLSVADGCLDEEFRKAIIKSGFDENKIATSVKKDYAGCIRANMPDNSFFEISPEKMQVFAEESDERMIIKVILPTKLSDGTNSVTLEEYKHEFSKISFDDVEADHEGKAIKDTKIFSADRLAAIYIPSGALLSQGNSAQRIVIKTKELPDADFLFGRFSYEVSPGSLPRDRPVMLELDYEHDWVESTNEYDFSLSIYNQQENEWRTIPSIVNKDKKKVKAIIKKPGTYAITTATTNQPAISGSGSGQAIGGFYQGGEFEGGDNRLVQAGKEDEEYLTDEDALGDCEPGETQGENVFFSQDSSLDSQNVNFEGNSISLSGCVKGTNNFNSDVYNINIHSAQIENIDALAVVPSQGIRVEKQMISEDEMIVYVNPVSDVKKEYTLTLTTAGSYPEIIFPAAGTEISYCFGDRNYPVSEEYIHAGTDIAVTGYALAACDGIIEDIWNYQFPLTDRCKEVMGTQDSYYYKKQPAEEAGVNYGNTVVIECDTGENSPGPMYLLYFHLAPENLYFRDAKGDYLDLCIGDEIKKEMAVGEIGTSGSSYGIHLHFEIRAGNPGPDGVPPRENSISPEILINYGHLSPDFEEAHNSGSSMGGEPDCSDTGRYTRGADERDLFPNMYTT